MNQRSLEAPIRRLIASALIGWLAMIGVDLVVHAGVLARFYVEPSAFLLPPQRAFSLIPLGYLSFLLTAALVTWLAWCLDLRGWIAGLAFGIPFGVLQSAAWNLGLASITTADPALLAGWFIGQSAQVAIGASVIGAALTAPRLRPLLIRVIVFVLAMLIVVVILQSTGVAPALRANGG